MNLPPKLHLLLALAAAFAAAGAIAAAEPDPEARPAGAAGSEETPGPKPGWLRIAKSLLYYDDAGGLSSEIGLGRWEESGPDEVRIKVIDGGTAPNHSFAWTLDKRSTWNTQKTKLLNVKRVLRFFDSKGRELWTEEEADFLPGQQPLVFSQDGKVSLVALHRQSGWFAAVKTYLGNTQWEIGPFPRLEALQISPSGCYGLARWNDPDKSAVHSLLDLANQSRQDVPSDRFFLGKTEIDDQGQVFSGKELIFSFTGPVISTTSAPSVSTAPLTQVSTRPAQTPAPEGTSP
jgi:hypothetical protein